MSRELEDENKRLRQKLDEQDVAWRHEMTCDMKAILSEISSLKTDQQIHRTETNSTLEKLEKDVERATDEMSIINTAVLGKGEQEPGLMMRMDRQEQHAKTISNWFYLLLPVSVTALGSVIWGWITGKPPLP